jgi:predicted permease
MGGGFMTDLAYSFRLLTRHPRYTILAVLTLAAGIGVNTAMFGLLDAVFFRPLPIVEPERLVDLGLQAPNSRFGSFSYQEFRDIERDASAFKHVFAVGRRGVTLNQNGEAQLLLIHYVSGRYFPSLGIPMHAGRGFSEADDRPESQPPQVVINHHVWQERLGAPPDIIGRAIQLNNTMFTVIGVTAAGFAGLNRTQRTDVWVTTAQAPFVVRGLREELDNRRTRWFRITGRLADGVEIDRANSELDGVLARWRADDSREYQDARISVRGQGDAARDATRQGTIVLSLVGLVLLIACANVANLTLARGEGRRRELALRTALGASRVSLLRQLGVESALIALGGTLAGLLLASWLVASIPRLLPPDASSLVLDIRFDGRLLTFAALLAALTTALVGAVPAWRGSRASVTSGLKTQGSTTTSGTRGLQLRDVLVVSEIALSGVVVIAAGLLVRAFVQSQTVDLGFDTQKQVATFYVVPGLKGLETDATYRYLEEARLSTGTVPGVRRSSYAIRLPAQSNEAGWAAQFRIPGIEPPRGTEAFEIRYTMVGPDYFDVMGTKIVQGRGITAADRPDTTAVAIVSESMARRFWPGERAVGRRLVMGRQRQVDREVVGVAEDIRISGLYEAPEPYVYVPYAQQQQNFAMLLVETDLDATSVIGPVRQRLAAINPAIPVLNVGSLEQHMNLLLYEDRRNAWIGFAMAVLALTLGAVGVHGVVALVTARRTREMGIRLALGAERLQVLRLLLGRGLGLAIVGTSLGIAGGIVAGRLLEGQLHGIDPADLPAIAAGTAILMGAALAASFMPAWRASLVDPVVALRDE